MAPASYAQLMDTMIAAWRKGWNKEFPFYYVQIAPYKYEKPIIGALVREAQAKNLSIKKTGMVVVSDLVNDTLNIHPVNKKDVGLRLADLALVETYKIKKQGYKSPVFRSLLIKGQYAVVDFDHAENGLMVKGAAAREAFIAGADRKFYPAVVEIKNNSILVSNKAVKNPVAVRYQFSNSGIGNLFSKAGLPVAPFRTDSWASDL
jgi:sialate O-acetylesterase